MYAWLLRHRIIVTGALVATLVYSVGYILYQHIGYELVESVYNGTSFGVLNGMIDHESGHSLQFYLDKADWVVYGSGIMLVALFVLTYLYQLVPPRYSLYALIIFADIVLIGLGEVMGGVFSARTDLGIPEFFQYFKEAFIALVFLLLFIKRRDVSFISLSVLFLYILLDDSLQYHEHVGKFIGGLLPLQERQSWFALQPNDVGEMISLLIPGLGIGGLLAHSYLRGSGTVKSVFHTMISLFLGLAFFGVIVDLIHSGINNASLYTLFGLIEESGEMIVMSIAAIVAYRTLILYTDPVNDTRMVIASVRKGARPATVSVCTDDVSGTANRRSAG